MFGSFGEEIRPVRWGKNNNKLFWVCVWCEKELNSTFICEQWAVGIHYYILTRAQKSFYWIDALFLELYSILLTNLFKLKWIVITIFPFYIKFDMNFEQSSVKLKLSLTSTPNITHDYMSLYSFCCLQADCNELLRSTFHPFIQTVIITTIHRS